VRGGLISKEGVEENWEISRGPIFFGRDEALLIYIWRGKETQKCK